MHKKQTIPYLQKEVQDLSDIEVQKKNQAFPNEAIEFIISDDEDDGKNEGDHTNMVIMINEQEPQYKGVFGITLVREIFNPLNQRLSRKDALTAFNTLFKSLQMIKQSTAQLPILSLKEVIIEPILSTGILKGTISIDLSLEMYQLVMSNPNCSQVLLDEKKGIQREFKFYFQDLDKLKQKHQTLQTGKFDNEFIQLSNNEAEGSQTQIIVAMHIRDNQIYAIKKVPLQNLPNWTSIHTNQIVQIREIKSMLRLSHQNVLRLFSWWIEEQEVTKEVNLKKIKYIQPFLYLQTEYIVYRDQSNDLLQFIQANFELQNIPIAIRRQKITVIFKQILKGIKYISEQGLFHRDIKPENILMTEDIWGGLLVKICDFDFSKSVTLGEEKNLTLSQFSILQSRNSGTISYTSDKFLNRSNNNIRSLKGQVYDTTEEIYMLGNVLLDLCKLYPQIESRKLYHLEASKKLIQILQNLYSIIPQSVLESYPEEIKLYRAMNQEKKFKSIKQLKESQEWKGLIKLFSN